MQLRLRFILLCLVSYLSLPTVKAQLTLEVTNIKESRGNMFIAIYDTEATFMDSDEAIHRDIVAIRSTNFVTTFSDLPSGKYAIALFHDENQNNELDTGWFGIPKEGYGFSNDAQGKMGPPSYEAASFNLEEGKEKRISIKLR